MSAVVGGSGFGAVVARDLSPEEAEARAQHCYELEEKIKASLRVAQESVWDLAEALYKFDDANRWSALGYDKLGDWLAQTEVGISRSHYYRLVSVYHEMAVIRQVDAKRLKQIEPQKLQIVLPAIKSGKVQLEEALDDAEALGRRDLRERYFTRVDPAEEFRRQQNEVEVEDVDEVEVAVPMNPTDDTPVWADEKPTHNDDNAQKGKIEEAITLLNLGLSPDALDEDKTQAMSSALALLTEMFPEVVGPNYP